VVVFVVVVMIVMVMMVVVIMIMVMIVVMVMIARPLKGVGLPMFEVVRVVFAVHALGTVQSKSMGL